MIRQRVVKLIVASALLLPAFWIWKSYMSHHNLNIFSNQIDFSTADNITGFPYPIVPNIVHFFKFRNHNMTFTEMVCLLAAWCHQRPEKIIIHCDCVSLQGLYWNQIKDLRGVEIHAMNEPHAVFGRPLSSVYHAGDIARLLVLSRYGGIALDFDSYLVKSVDKFRHFEFTVGWKEGYSLGCQVMISHKDARVLKMWIDSYKFYRPEQWYYNAGDLPTKILEKSPQFVHRVPWLFGVNLSTDLIYKTNWSKWKDFFAIHLLIRHRSYLDSTSNIPNFNEKNILNYPHTFGAMARLVIYGTTNILNSSQMNWEYKQCRI